MGRLSFAPAKFTSLCTGTKLILGSHTRQNPCLNSTLMAFSIFSIEKFSLVLLLHPSCLPGVFPLLCFQANAVSWAESLQHPRRYQTAPIQRCKCLLHAWHVREAESKTRPMSGLRQTLQHPGVNVSAGLFSVARPLSLASSPSNFGLRYSWNQKLTFVL